MFEKWKLRWRLSGKAHKLGGMHMPGKGSRPGPKWLPVLCAALIVAAVCAGFTGCRADRRQILQAMTDAIAHRGPDGEGFYLGDGAALGHRRLSIIDLEGGNELYLTDNAVVIQTELLGPEKGEASGADMSYPVLIVKTQYMEEPVVFQ